MVIFVYMLLKNLNVCSIDNDQNNLTWFIRKNKNSSNLFRQNKAETKYNLTILVNRSFISTLRFLKTDLFHKSIFSLR